MSYIYICYRTAFVEPQNTILHACGNVAIPGRMITELCCFCLSIDLTGLDFIPVNFDWWRRERSRHSCDSSGGASTTPVKTAVLESEIRWISSVEHEYAECFECGRMLGWIFSENNSHVASWLFVASQFWLRTLLLISQVDVAAVPPRRVHSFDMDVQGVQLVVLHRYMAYWHIIVIFD